MISKTLRTTLLLGLNFLLSWSPALGVLGQRDQCESAYPPWTGNVNLIDTSDTYTRDQPPIGWHVTPIHATLLKDGKIFIVGWGRRDYINCQPPAGSRKHGVSFVIEADDILNGGCGEPDRERQLPLPTFVIPTPIDEKKKATADVLYCSGQVTLDDGRVFAIGGSTYDNLGEVNEEEDGIDYGRIFDPASKSMSVTSAAPIGNMWYPTAAKLPSGDILVTGGFFRYTTAEESDANANDQVALYHPSNNRWTTLGTVPDHLITPGGKDYTHTWLLPAPMKVNGLDRHIAMAGYKGTLVLANTDPNVPERDRWTAPQNQQRPSGGTAWDSTALVAGTGEFVIVGGGNGPEAVDLYKPAEGTWRSIQTGVKRDNGAAVLLPDGTILLINGQDRTDWNIVPPPQILDPWTGEIKTLPQWDDDENARAYHSVALLLKDGRILIGGGIDGKGHEIACERTDMRLFTPPYLQPRGSKNCVERPVIKASGDVQFKIRRNGKNGDLVTKVAFDGPAPRKTRGASLMALGSFTHAFDQNQRYVPLKIVANRPGEVELVIEDNQVPLGGLYNLYFIAEDGTPSVGVSARITVV